MRKLLAAQKCADRVSRCKKVKKMYKLYKSALERNDWDTVLELATEEDNTCRKKGMLLKAMEHHQAACAAGIFKQGATFLSGNWYSPPLLYEVISNQLLEQFEQFQPSDPQEMVNSPCCNFAIELLTLCDKAELVVAVVDKAMRNKSWGLLYALVSVGLGKKQLEDVAVCAAYHSNWRFAAFAVKMGCDSEEVVQDFFQQRKANFLIDLFRKGTLPVAVKLKVLLSAIVHNNGNIAKEMLQQCTSLEGVQLLQQEVGGLCLQGRDYKPTLRRVLCTIITAGRVDIISAFFQGKGRDMVGFVPSSVIFQITVETKSWKMLPSILTVLNGACESTKRKALATFVSQVLKDPKLIAVFAPSMDSWFQLVEFGGLENLFCELVCRNSSVSRNLSKLSELSAWCMEHSHFYMALFLEFFARFVNTSADGWPVELVRSAGHTLAPTSSMWSLLEEATVMANKSQTFSTWAAFVRFYPFDYSLGCTEFRELCEDLLYLTEACNTPLVPACQESGAWDWALFYFSLQDVPVERLLNMLEREVPLSQAALDVSFEKFVKSTFRGSELKCRVAAGLLSRYSVGRESVLSALAWLVSHSQMEVVETVLDNLDPCSLDEVDKSTMLASLHMVDRRTLLHKTGSALQQSIMSEALKLKFGCLCIGTGLSCYQRNLEIFTETTYWSECLLSESLSHPRFVQVLLESGAISYKALSSFCLANKSAMEEVLEDVNQEADNDHKQTYRLIQEAASQPLTLTQLARMAASSAIRCHPGRKERVKALPVPQFFQRWINFEDVTTCWLPRKERAACRFWQTLNPTADPDSPSVVQGYAGTAVIDFMVEQHIFVVGLGLYGSCDGPTTFDPVHIEIWQERTTVGCNDTSFQCDGSASTFRVMFKEPVEILPRFKYTVQVEYVGGEIYIGTGGLSTVTCNNVTFHFADNDVHHSSTSVDGGQIPEIIFCT